ncbi:membrane-spanning 4-domains subfamily A member 4A-like [Astyanax mexicanus]|uniref:Membrane-spanning 4-domains subfamily A member 4A-like n=1 Tax=Astyanax mexicanus TaxID=7994 RepID=A0A8B9L340_ASTMX|nr:membrane-spanning 4-domains subfamily A member 4A-like [Astyanax mexicanus]
MSTSVNPVPVVTHVITQQTAPAQIIQNVPAQGFSTMVTLPVRSVGSSLSSGLLGKFLKGQPKALGVVEIMIGVFTIASGIAVSQGESTFLYSGIAFWGSLIYISAGSLTVLAENKLHPCVVKGSLGMNVISAVTAGIVFIILVADLSSMNLCQYHSYYYSYYPVYCMNVASYLLLLMVLILTLLQFCISISISAFGCKATCCMQPTVMFVVSNPNVSNQSAVNPPPYE